MRTGEMRALCRRPALEDLQGVRADPRRPVDAERLLDQHREYVRVLRSACVDTCVLDPLPGHPEAFRVQDTAIVLPEVTILTRPRAVGRRSELADIERSLVSDRACLRLEAPAILDGGDVCAMDEVLYVGQSGRTNHAGLKALALGVLAYGYVVKAVEVRAGSCLCESMTRLDRGRILVTPANLDLGRVKGVEQVETVEQGWGAANVLALGKHLICSDAYPRTNEHLSRLGYDILEVGLSEFHRMGATVTCASIILDA